MTTPSTQPRVATTTGTFLVLILIGLAYMASIGYFLARGDNFVFRQMTTSATRFATSTTLTIPAKLSFTPESEWSKALATGWNRPILKPLWSNHRDATIVLPAIANLATDNVCISATVTTMRRNRHWPMLVTVNGYALEPRQVFAGAELATVRGTVPVSNGALLQVQFAGPAPRVPQLITRHSDDPRNLGFELVNMTITAQCDASGPRRPALRQTRYIDSRDDPMQDDSGLKHILTSAWVYKLYQDLVGATRGRQWISQNFWNVRSGHKVVDIGCGPGNVIQHLPQGVRYVGFDVSERYIQHARRAFAGDPDKTFLVGTADDFIANLPEPMRNADLVIMSGLLHHLDDHEALTALRLAKAVMGEHGRLVALEGTFLVRQSRLSHWLVSQDRGRNVRTEPEWKALVAKVFTCFETCILTGLDRTPYTYIVIEAFANADGNSVPRVM